jgi:hypothetical protein
VTGAARAGRLAGTPASSSARVALPCLALGLAACVLPIAPEFEPPENFSPYIASTSEPVGRILLQEGPEGRIDLSVTVGDPNLGDTLYYKWILDYPVFSFETRVITTGILGPSQNGSPERPAIVFDLALCDYNPVDLQGQPHRLTLAVSDREFLTTSTGEARFTTVPEGAHLLMASWITRFDCPRNGGAP